MKKTYVAVIAIAAAIVVSLAATVAILQYQSPTMTGRLVVMGTDPPISAAGVQRTTAHYNSVSAHKAGNDMSSGWVQVQGSGTMDLTSSAGTAQTMAVSQVSAGTYDAFRYNIDSVKVTYQGQDYVATVASSTLTAQSNSKVIVNQNSSAAAVVDMRTFIINTGTTSNPQFMFSATAVATDVPPSSSLLSISLQVGGTADLSSELWWNSFVASSSSNVNIAATLTSSKLTIDAQNSGSANAEIQQVIVTPVSASAMATASLPASYAGSAVFTVDSSGTVVSTTSIQDTALLNSGTSLATGSSATLNYSGNVLLNFGSGSVQVTGVVPGQQYLVTVIGANTYASTVVVAS